MFGDTVQLMDNKFSLTAVRFQGKLQRIVYQHCSDARSDGSDSDATNSVTVTVYSFAFVRPINLAIDNIFGGCMSDGLINCRCDKLSSLRIADPDWK
ncbi:Hypothetical predicted protein [Octopus vulgaris]|uniref:Uncharacterized protein n=1 Tax=Octopus vulgaris TaxID=6645 RepID=A0AA36AW43_OCTVU|nr:Hypothetical predicted protein [Octopus vulgaris]